MKKKKNIIKPKGSVKNNKKPQKKRGRFFRYLLYSLLLFAAAIVYSFCCVSFLTPDDRTVLQVMTEVPKDAEYVVMVDFSKPSAQERLYIYDVKEREFVYSGVVQHGLGRGSTARTPEYSNELGSKCSSLGLYRIGELSKIHRIKHTEIPCFRLDGLSPTNSNARRRGILIHPSMTATLLPFEIWGVSLPLTTESEGCFAVSVHTMVKIAQLNLEGKMYMYAYHESPY